MPEAPPAERKPRKSVAFSEGNTIVDSNGEVTEVNGGHGEGNSAETHSRGTEMPEQHNVLDSD